MDVLMFIIKWILMIPFMWGLLFISIFFHEMGHLIMYLIFYRENNWRIEIGSKGKKSLEIGRFTIYPKMLTGHIYYNYKKYNKLNSIMVSAGGPLVNLILIIFIIIYLFNFCTDKTGLLYWCICFLFYSNLAQFLCTIIPIKIKDYISDGWRIIDDLRGDYE
ncbi:site-2 protease family protein [Parvimonas sp. D2]|uniref:site-2 protease family protein n=1 Tax=unclassified Parvimonas TaxID=1151464 RepID=UPI002B47BAB8|nr:MULTISPECIES: site-2 protease family protein [unclassified Parvimonas]MEB3012190.1 site-2 protease family protein [Parvimonas sp. D2]MEB3087865.1 site-2 protease family protein [Parvimonas sp. D4]